MPANGEIHDVSHSSNNREVDASRTHSNEMLRLADLDGLTGLPNQSVFNDRVGQAILLARRRRALIAVLMVSLDGLIEITGSLGHPVGNEILQSVSRRILGSLRTHDTVSRFGNDKFLILMQDIQQPEDVAVAARRMRKALASAFLIDHHEVHVAASIGASIYPEDCLTAPVLMKHAETAMYQAKKNGLRHCHFYRPDTRAASSQSIEQSLPFALERNELTLHYQAKFDLKTGSVSGVEALTRWTHPIYGSIPPGQFIPIAEKSCLILPIGAWVLREACIQSQAWAGTGTPTKSIAVNISGTEFQSENFLEGICSILSETGRGPESLELDVAHDVLMSNPGRSAFILKTLRDKGIHVSVDNFGAGDITLASLEDLPVSAIKIDRQVVRRITSLPDGATVVGAIIRLGRLLNMRVIAEGVETAGDMEFLWEHDCDEAQGNFLSRPMPPEQLAGQLGSRQSSSRKGLTPRQSEKRKSASCSSDSGVATAEHSVEPGSPICVAADPPASLIRRPEAL